MVFADGELTADALSGEELQIVSRKLWQLLAKRTALYTMGDSSSVPVETAQELLASILFTLEEYRKEYGESQKRFVTAELDPLLKLGTAVIESRVKDGRRLWQAACLSAPKIENISYRDTLRNIEGFFKHYDCRFFAHQIPCEIDYQLCRPVSDQCRGVEYIDEYLRHIVMENSILSRFESHLVLRVLEGYCPDYNGLLINLCEPVITNAIGLTLVGGQPQSLEVTEEDRARIAALFETLSDSKGRMALTEAARQLCRIQGITETAEQEYLTRSAEDLYPRISAALPAGGLDGIFVSFI